jgi:hypothetical protein
MPVNGFFELVQIIGFAWKKNWREARGQKLRNFMRPATFRRPEGFEPQNGTLLNIQDEGWCSVRASKGGAPKTGLARVPLTDANAPLLAGRLRARLMFLTNQWVLTRSLG